MATEGVEMKAQPLKVENGEWINCAPEEATHVRIYRPGPAGKMALPVLLKGQREGTPCWTWNGDCDRPTLRPSVLTRGVYSDGKDHVCHSWITDGQIHFLEDCTHSLAGQTLDLLDLQGD
jgi:hypothetical protein